MGVFDTSDLLRIGELKLPLRVRKQLFVRVGDLDSSDLFTRDKLRPSKRVFRPRFSARWRVLPGGGFFVGKSKDFVALVADFSMRSCCWSRGGVGAGAELPNFQRN